MSVATNEKELGEALKRGEDSIEIEFQLKDAVLRIKAKEKVAWGVCIGAISVAVVSILAVPASGGATTVPSALISTPALASTVAILGGPATISAITIAVAGGGAGVLNKLRDYRVEKVSEDKIILHKK